MIKWEGTFWSWSWCEVCGGKGGEKGGENTAGGMAGGFVAAVLEAPGLSLQTQESGLHLNCRVHSGKGREALSIPSSDSLLSPALGDALGYYPGGFNPSVTAAK